MIKDFARELLAALVRFLLWALTKTEFEGLENIPLEGGIIVATNHLSLQPTLRETGRQHLTIPRQPPAGLNSSHALSPQPAGGRLQ